MLFSYSLFETTAVQNCNRYTLITLLSGLADKLILFNHESKGAVEFENWQK